MRRPWVQSLFCFLVTLIGLESITGLVWLFNGGDKMIEICLWSGVMGAAWMAYRAHDHAVHARPRDPLEMTDAERREHLRRVREELDKRVPP